MLRETTIATPSASIRITESEGTGFPILMLHGAGSTRHVFRPQLESTLAQSFRLIAMDFPGHGDSGNATDPATTYTQRGYAAAVLAVVEALQLHRFAIYGWSLGGHVGIELLAHHPGVAGLMLTGAPPIAHGPFAMLRGFQPSWDMLLASKEHFSPRDVARFARLCYGDAPPAELVAAIERTDGRARAVYSRALMKGEGVDQRRTVENARVPIAVVNGEHDPFVRLSYFDTVDYPYLWDGQCRIIRGAGHAPFRDAADRFNTLLARFATDAQRFRATEAIARRA